MSIEPRHARALLALIAVLMLSASTFPDAAYDDDTHYYYTYYLARISGFDSEAARQIASGNIAVDLDPRTEPFQKMGLTRPAQSVRIRFHAFTRSRGVPLLDFPIDAPGMEPKEVRRACYTRAWDTGNPGQYLHFYMDTYSHQGFASRIGHAVGGHKPDFLSNNVDRAREMTRGALRILTEFRKRRPLAPNAANPEVDSLYILALPVLNRLVSANAAAFSGRPDAQRAKAIVTSALKEPVPDIIRFAFQPDGLPREGQRWMVTAPVLKGLSAQPSPRGTPEWQVRLGNVFVESGRSHGGAVRVSLDGRPVTYATSPAGSDAILVIAADIRQVSPGQHTLAFDNPGPDKRLYRTEVDVQLNPGSPPIVSEPRYRVLK